MKKNLALIISVAGFVLLSFNLTYLFGGEVNFPNLPKSMLAGFFPERVSTEKIKNNYIAAQNGQNDHKIKILIVPGHDENSPGASFQGRREVDMTTVLGEEIYALLKDEPHYETVLLRGENGYNADFVNFFQREKENTAQFRDQKKKEMAQYLSAGFVEKIDGAPHADATEDTSLRLYAINRWADTIGVSIVFNLHFNDFPRRYQKLPGEYEGFAIYVPHEVYGNSKASRGVAEKILYRLAKHYLASNYPEEAGGIVPDQELISLGANDTLSAASVLIEYGYMYEPQFKYSEARNFVMRDLALQTYLGLQDFFGAASPAVKDIAFLPYLWEEDIKKGDEGKAAVVALQAALLKTGFYPPAGKSKDDCPITGSFKECTARALLEFQKKNGIISDGTVAGPQTREILNRLFGS